MTKSILFFILFIFFTGYLRSETNTLSFVFEDDRLPTDSKIKIEDDLKKILTILQDREPFLVPYTSTNAPPNTVARIRRYSSYAFPDPIISRVEYIVRDSDGKNAVWITQEVSDIYTNRFAEIESDLIPFEQFTTFVNRLQRMKSEPLSDAEFYHCILFPKIYFPVNPGGAAFSEMMADVVLYPPSLLSIQKMSEEEQKKMLQIFQSEHYPELTENSFPMYRAHIMGFNTKFDFSPSPQGCYFFNNHWHFVP